MSSASSNPGRRRGTAQTAHRSRRGRLRPSGRSIVAGLALLALAGGAYAAAHQSSLFALSTVEVAGAPPDVQKQVRRQLEPFLGTSLLALDGRSLERRVESLPSVVKVRYDRAFPHTLRLTIVPEKPVAVLRRGPDTWLLSGRGRIVKRVPPRTYPALPRIWVPHATHIAPGEVVRSDGAASAARAVALGARFPARIATAAVTHEELVLRLRSGLVLRLGKPSDVRLKLAVARRALRVMPTGMAYLDVSVPGRPVAGANPQLSGRA